MSTSINRNGVWYADGSDINPNLAEHTNEGATNWSWSGNGGSRSAVDDEDGIGVVLTTVTAANSGSWSCIYFTDYELKNKITAGKTYTASVDVWSSVAMSNFTCTVMQGNATHNMFAGYHGVPVPANTWTHATWILQPSSDQSVTSQVGYFAGTPATTVVGTVVKLRNFKFEEGSVATPWIPNESDEIYILNTQGFNEGRQIASVNKGSLNGNSFIEL